ncbi:uncharacterized protein LOC111057631 [Nilaparvata lugens]|uniref:uncharacterized protein LOC111057631 n=1 Tax=Nilaparvata lugens TaxID=108931 RepID=UPI00193DF2E3|nr:uncharacterized protein LOC111057631 [Nilaparvata lugens]
MAADSDECYQSTNSKPKNEESSPKENERNINYEENIILVKSEYISDHETLDELDTTDGDFDQSLQTSSDIDGALSENVSSKAGQISEPVAKLRENDNEAETERTSCSPDIKRGIEEDEDVTKNDNKIEEEEDADDPDSETETNAVETRKIFLPAFPISHQNVSFESYICLESFRFCRKERLFSLVELVVE